MRVCFADLFASRWRGLFLLICFDFVGRCVCIVGLNLRLLFASICWFDLTVLMRMCRLGASFCCCCALGFARVRHC